MKRWLAVFIFFAFAHSANAQQAVVITEDHGGRIGTYLDKYNDMRAAGVNVEIRGVCESACTILLSRIPKDRVCVTPAASFGFHMAWNMDENGHAVTNPEASEYLYSLYPPNVQRLIRAHGGLHPNMFHIHASAFGYKRCKPNQIFAQAH